MKNFPQQFQALVSQKRKKLFDIFYCISQMCMKFEHFEEKDEYPSLVISKIYDSERSG